MGSMARGFGDSLVRLFGKVKLPYRESTHEILDNDMRFPITLEYANEGIENGWLELVHYRIDLFNVEHLTYRHVPP